jgi:hypothetical protein
MIVFIEQSAQRLTHSRELLFKSLSGLVLMFIEQSAQRWTHSRELLFKSLSGLVLIVVDMILTAPDFVSRVQDSLKRASAERESVVF